MLLFILGLIGLWFASGIVVDNSIKLAHKLKIHEGFIGLTILSIGTSLPEIFTHIIASSNILLNKISLEAASNISIGTNIGSNIIQITLITGLIALITKVQTSKKILEQDYVIMLGAIILLFILGYDGRITQLEGISMIFLYFLYLFLLQKEEQVFTKIKTSKSNIGVNLLIISIGIVILIFSADEVLKGAIELANIWNVTESLIGVTLIGVSTALPELTTALRGIFRGSTSLSLGTLIGSNITNPMLALGLGATISSYSMENVIQFYDIPFWFISSVVIYYFFKSEKKITKTEASLMILAYFGYIYFRISS
tara:strand:+ start:648 stop:1583 length:936 start_codon:yes stop_codon:yes gene_type:complete